MKENWTKMYFKTAGSRMKPLSKGLFIAFFLLTSLYLGLHSYRGPGRSPFTGPYSTPALYSLYWYVYMYMYININQRSLRLNQRTHITFIKGRYNLIILPKSYRRKHVVAFLFSIKFQFLVCFVYSNAGNVLDKVWQDKERNIKNWSTN